MVLATGLAAGEHRRGADEMLEVFDLPFETYLAMTQRSETAEGKTLIALFIAEKHLKQAS